MNFEVRLFHWFTTASHWRGSNGVPHRVYEHLSIAGISVVAALLVALPLALWLGHLGRGGFAAISVTNAGRAIPSFALLVIGFELFGLGATPVFLALFALSVPPIVTNTYTAIRGVDPDVKQAAVGMGMTGWQVLTRVEIPNAVPLMFAGIRTAGVQAVATATLGAVVAWGGVGRYIVDGIAQQDHVQVVAGALIVAVLSFFAEIALATLQRAVTPKGLRSGPAAGRRSLSHLPGAAANAAATATAAPTARAAAAPTARAAGKTTANAATSPEGA